MLALKSFKGTVSVISCDPSCKEGNTRYTVLPFQPLNVHRVRRAMCVNVLTSCS